MQRGGAGAAWAVDAGWSEATNTEAAAGLDLVSCTRCQERGNQRREMAMGGAPLPGATSRRREAPEERGVVPHADARGRSADAGATWC